MKRIGRTVAVAALSVLAAGALAGCGANLDREVEVQGMLMEVPSDWLQETGAGNSDSRGTVSFIEEDDDRDEDETGNMIEVSYRRIADSTPRAEPQAGSPLGEDADGKASESDDPADSEGPLDAPTTPGGTDSEKTSTDNSIASQGSPSAETAADAKGTADAAQATHPKAATSDSGEGAVINDEAAGRMADIAPAPRTAVEAMVAKQASLEEEQGVTAWSIDEEKARVIDGAQVTSYEYSFVKEIDGERRKYEFKTVFVFTQDMMYEVSLVGGAVGVDALIDTIEL